MKVTFISNFLNHHQLPFCLEMKKALGDNFSFVATSKISKERLDMGYTDINEAFSFVVKAYENNKNEAKVFKLVSDSDVVIIGAAPEKYIKERIKKNKLIIRYSERPFKKGFIDAVFSKKIIHIIKKHTINYNKNIYMLCASAHGSRDYFLAGAYINKCFKWGYFPEVKSYNLTELMKKKKTP
jgi:hypothetical protein